MERIPSRSFRRPQIGNQGNKNNPMISDKIVLFRSPADHTTDPMLLKAACFEGAFRADQGRDSPVCAI